MERYKYQVGLFMVFFCMHMFGQGKYEESFLVKRDVHLKVDAAYTNIVLETWTKNKVSVEGIIEGSGLSTNEIERLYKDWDIEAIGNSSAIEIVANSNSNGAEVGENQELSFIEPLVESIVGPMIKNLANSPLSDDFTSNMSHLNFDYEAYKKDPKGYMKEWEMEVEKAYEKKEGKHVIKQKVKVTNENEKAKRSLLFGFPNSPFPVDLDDLNFDDKEYKENKSAYVSKLNKKHKSRVTTKEVDLWLEEIALWEKDFEEKMEQWGEKLEESMEDWGENFERKMEEWGAKLERWADNFAEDFEENEKNQKKYVHVEKFENASLKKTPRTLYIKVPENAVLNIALLYGNLKAENLENKANISLKYGSLKAGSIANSSTRITAAYSSINVRNWVAGSLELKYAKNNYIDNAKTLNLVSSGSDVSIQKLSGDAIINGSFGDLSIEQIDSNFENLDIVLENTDARVKLPKGSYNLYYNGNKSKLKYPKMEDVSEISNGSTKIIKGYKGTSSSKKNIHISAKYSDVLLE
ncbi:DUF4097 family beta strand repeat-containing protein [Flavicella sediminum]|uniref:hypothetical protein n=1 Tax=Flavicella sediminum TaxID=2585141 RepID=UPI00111F9343|nr:hypothetical protein [Flavicella sediminum]